MTAVNEALREELEAIRMVAGGLLKPRDVVDAARNPNSTLHHMFEWSDAEAADKYRLVKAAAIIRTVRVEVTRSAAVTVNVRAYTSLPEDRVRGNGGYRPVIEVLHDADARGRMLNQALRELEAFRAKYAALGELAPLFEQFDALRAAE